VRGERQGQLGTGSTEASPVPVEVQLYPSMPDAGDDAAVDAPVDAVEDVREGD
jgi:hypothetical protein